MSIKVYNDDNFSFVPDNSIDFILTDPPFNISKKSNFHTYEGNTIHSYQFDNDQDEMWDSYTHTEFLTKLDDWAKEFNRVLKKGGNFAIFTADLYISHLMEALKNNGLSPRRVISWRKPNAVPVNRAYMPSSAVEYVIVGVKGGNATFNADVAIQGQGIDAKLIEATLVADKVASIVSSQVKKNILEVSLSETLSQRLPEIDTILSTTLEEVKKEVSKRVRSMYKTKPDGEEYLQGCVPNYIESPLKTGKRIHPTEKPIIILEYLLALYSHEGDTVLDSFAGSGSTGEACHNMNRNAILVERDKTFYSKIMKRLENKTDE